MSLQALPYPTLQKLHADLQSPSPTDPSFLGAVAVILRAALADLVPAAKEKWDADVAKAEAAAKAAEQKEPEMAGAKPAAGKK